MRIIILDSEENENETNEIGIGIAGKKKMWENIDELTALHRSIASIDDG